ncbi:MAG: hypothetical protein AB7V08_08625 [Elusimicrobiales bacterium]
MKNRTPSRSPRALARRLKTPICKTCGQPKIAVTAYAPEQKPRFSFECWTQGCTTGAWKPWEILKASEAKH